jgi:hypothetical protein
VTTLAPEEITLRSALHPAAATRAMVTSADRPRLTWHQDVLTCLLCTWLMMGLFMDAWAHTNQTTLDSIATPWHGLFYGSFLALASWILWHLRWHHDAGHRGLAAIPVGYGGAVLGLMIFSVGAIGDQVWHLTLGIERDLKAFLSPTHLLLIIGMLLMVSAPLRSQWSRPGPMAPTFRQFLPAIWSLTLTMMLTGIAYNYAYIYPSGLVTIGQKGFVQGFPGQTSIPLLNVFSARFEVQGLLMMHMTTFILVLPILVALRRWRRLPFGSITLLVTTVTGAVLEIFQYSFGWTLLAAVIGGLAMDLLARALKPNTSSVWAFRTFALLAPMVLWIPYFVVIAIAYHVGWPLELSTGSTVLTGFATLAMSFLVAPSPIPPYTDSAVSEATA